MSSLPHQGVYGIVLYRHYAESLLLSIYAMQAQNNLTMSECLVSVGVELVMLTWMSVPTAGGALREYRPSYGEDSRNNLLSCL